ncbi:hypothetical protein EVAR_53991_1 [Eumeta japonica]|uniref:Uncharacterized protein n=1 Tax=Eumeta variegata TaxID=151549 RepID=A0A4C1YPL8_EUMVA|nr:hypothetical protein EVAR_53991_1 [Eumeta japonica]
MPRAHTVWTPSAARLAGYWKSRVRNLNRYPPLVHTYRVQQRKPRKPVGAPGTAAYERLVGRSPTSGIKLEPLARLGWEANAKTKTGLDTGTGTKSTSEPTLRPRTVIVVVSGSCLYCKNNPSIYRSPIQRFPISTQSFCKSCINVTSSHLIFFFHRIDIVRSTPTPARGCRIRSGAGPPDTAIVYRLRETRRRAIRRRGSGTRERKVSAARPTGGP